MVKVFPNITSIKPNYEKLSHADLCSILENITNDMLKTLYWFHREQKSIGKGDTDKTTVTGGVVNITPAGLSVQVDQTHICGKRKSC